LTIDDYETVLQHVNTHTNTEIKHANYVTSTTKQQQYDISVSDHSPLLRAISLMSVIK